MSTPAVASGGREARRPPKRWLLAFGTALTLVLVGVAVYLGVDKPWSANGTSSEDTTKETPSSIAVKTQAAGSAPAGGQANSAAISPASTAGAAGQPAPATSTAATATSSAATTNTGSKPSNDLVSTTAGLFGLSDKQVIAGGEAAGFCTIETTAELEAAVAGDACSVIILTSEEYEPKATLAITRPLLIIGSPLFLPLLNGSKTPRLFHVFTGGLLELRNVRTYAGRGEIVSIAGRSYLLRIGLVARVELGGQANFFGVSLLQPEQTVENFIAQMRQGIENQRITLGGYIFVAGGTFNMIGCTVFRFQPLGNATPSDLSVGRDILLLFGTVNIVGVTYISIQFWHIKLTAGGIVGVVGGTLGVYGLNIATVTILNNQFGAGLQTFIGGGNGIHIGVNRASFSVTTVRGGFGLFSVGGGTLVATGTNMATAAVLRAEWGTGTWSLGGGVITLVGIQSYSTHVSAATWGSGFHYFNGGGNLVLIGSFRCNYGQTTFQSGVGFHSGNMAGITTFIGGTSFTTCMTRYQEGLGTEAYLGAGFLTFVRVYRFRIIAIGTFIGQGNQVYVGAGAGVFIDNFQDAFIITDWRSSSIYNPKTGAATNFVYTVNGATATRGQANTDIYMDVRGRFNVPGFPSNFRRALQAQEGGDNPDEQQPEEIPKALALVMGDYYYENQVPLDTPVQPLATIDPFNPAAALFEAYRRRLEAQSAYLPENNQLAILTNNTACLAADVSPDLLLGTTPCIPSTATGETLAERINSLFVNAAEAVPDELLSFATDNGLLGTLRRTAHRLTQERPEDVSDVSIYQLHLKTAVYCTLPAGSTTKNCSTPETFKDVLRYTLGDINGLAEELSVSTYELKVKDEFFKFLGDDLNPLLASLEPAGSATPGCDGYTVYSSTVTIRNQKIYNETRAIVHTLVADSSELLHNLESVTDNDKATLCETVVEEESAGPIFAGASEVNSYFFGAGRSQGPGEALSSITLGADDVFGYATKATRDKDYTVRLARFAPGSTVTVDLVDVETHAVVAPAIQVASIPVNGKSKFEWRVPASVPTGRNYVLRATGSKSAIGGSLQADDTAQFLVL